jgi:Tol biopolymer transport system component
LYDYTDIALAADGHALATVLNDEHRNLFLMSEEKGDSQARQITSDAPVYTFTWTRAARIVIGGAANLSMLDPESGATSELKTQDTFVPRDPTACPDGRFIVFTALRGPNGARNIWQVDANGRKLKQLTDGTSDKDPVCSPDSQWVFYSQGEQFGGRLMKIHLDGGKPEKISDTIVASSLDISPDGKLAVFVTLPEVDNSEDMLAVVSTDSAQSAKRVAFQKPRTLVGPRFSRDGKAITYPFRENGIDNLWLQPLDGSPGKQVTHFNSERIYGFRWSFDGSKMGLIRGHTDSDVILIRESQ